MTGDTAVHQLGSGRWLRAADAWWSLLRVVLVVLWVGWAAATWWSAPRSATVAQARADLSAGRMASYEWADGWDSERSWNWAATPTLRSSGPAGPLFVWRTPNWRIRYTVLDDVPRVPGSFPAATDIDSSAYSGPEAASLAQTLRSADQEPGSTGGHPPQPIATLVLILGLSSLFILVAGPAPVTGTRWFWFWLVSGVPFGLGLLYWLARERPWSRTVVARVGPIGRDPRRRWYLGIGLAILTGIASSLLVYWLSRLLGAEIVPLPPSG